MMSTHEKTFLDIRVFHPNAPSYKNKSIEQLYTSHEQEKKRAYTERVLQVEKGSFTPIVMSTAGGMSKEAAKHHRRIAQLIADKRRVLSCHELSKNKIEVQPSEEHPGSNQRYQRTKST